MAELEKQVRRVWRRLTFQQFLDSLVWCWVAALVGVLGWVTWEKISHREILPLWASIASGLGAGLFAAVAIAVWRRCSAVDAAVALDREFQLKERISSTLTLTPELRSSPAGQALVADALKRVESVYVPEKFGVQMPRTAWTPLVPAVMIGLVWAFVTGPAVEQKAEAKSVPPAEQKQVQNSSKQLTKKFEQQKELAKKEGLKEAEKMLTDFQKMAKNLTDSTDVDRKKAMSDMHNIQDRIKERRDKLGSSEQIQKQLEKMQLGTKEGPADKFQEALKQGDFKKATEEIKKLADAVKQGKLTPDQKKELEKQLGAMKEQLQKLSNMDERRKQLMNAGLPPDVLQQELAKLDAQSAQLQQMAQLAEKLAKAQEALKAGDLDKMLENMQMTAADLQKLMNELKELEMLENALNSLADMKNGLACQNCAGFG